MTDSRGEWDETYREAYAAGRRYWRAELATPPAFSDFMASEWAPLPPARILEAGCGDGLNAVGLARKGYAVTGVDFSPAAIGRARETALEAGVEVEFLCLDITREDMPPRDAYDLWVDIKTLHCIWDNRDRAAYLKAAADALCAEGVFFMNCGLALADVRDYFGDVFESLDEATRAQAATLDRNLPPDKRSGIRCETLDWYCRELEAATFRICQAKREASAESGWGAIIVARAPA